MLARGVPQYGAYVAAVRLHHVRRVLPPHQPRRRLRTAPLRARRERCSALHKTTTSRCCQLQNATAAKLRHPSIQPRVSHDATLTCQPSSFPPSAPFPAQVASSQPVPYEQCLFAALDVETLQQIFDLVPVDTRLRCRGLCLEWRYLAARHHSRRLVRLGRIAPQRRCAAQPVHGAPSRCRGAHLRHVWRP